MPEMSSVEQLISAAIASHLKEYHGRAQAFVPPIVADVAQYAIQIGYQLDAEQFVDFYQAKNWFIGKNKMKDWQAAVRTWQRQNRKASKMRLLPMPGKTCSVKGCKMPAVYRDNRVTYECDAYRCSEHLPLEVKEKYE